MEALNQEHLFIFPNEKLTSVKRWIKYVTLQVSQSQKQIMVSSILPKNEQKSLFWVFPKEKMLRIVIFCSFWGRMEDTINCFWDFLTFNHAQKNQLLGAVHKLSSQVLGFFNPQPPFVDSFCLIKADIFRVPSHFYL